MGSSKYRSSKSPRLGKNCTFSIRRIRKTLNYEARYKFCRVKKRKKNLYFLPEPFRSRVIYFPLNDQRAREKKKKKEKRGNRNSSKSNQSLLPIDRFVSRKFWPGQDIIDGEQKAPFTVLSEWYSISFFLPQTRTPEKRIPRNFRNSDSKKFNQLIIAISLHSRERDALTFWTSRGRPRENFTREERARLVETVNRIANVRARVRKTVFSNNFQQGIVKICVY